MKSSKDEYILKNLYKIKHKKWELFVISRILHLLNDWDIEFACQQLIKTKNGRYFADICFPSLKLYYEIDERQHSSTSHSLSDQERKKEIIDASDYVEERIRIYNENNDDRDINDIIAEIDQFVSLVKKKKENLLSKDEFIPWDYENKLNHETFIKRGYIDIKDNVSFFYQRDALRCFGYKKGHYQRSLWHIKGSDKGVWFPKLYKDKAWKNSLSEDHKKITMQPQPNNAHSRKRMKEITNNKNLPGKRIVFAHQEDVLGRRMYKFLGEFHKSEKESDRNHLIFRRKQTRIDLR